MQYKWKMVALLFCCAALNYGDRAATTTVFPLLQSDLGMTSIGMAAVGSFFLWTYALGSPIAGILADRLSRRLMIALSLAAWSLVTLATGFATTVTQFLIARALLGFAECLYLPAAVALIADHHDADSRATAIGIHTAGLGIGLVAGGSASGYIGAHYGWQAAFRTLGMLGILLAVGAYFYLRDGENQEQRAVPAFEWARLKALLLIPTFTIILSEALIAAVASHIFINWLPLFFKESYGLSLAAAGFSGTFLLQFSSVAGATVGGVVSDKAARRSRPRRMLVQALCYFAATPILGVFLFQPVLGLISAAILVFGFLRAIGSANENPMLCDLLPPRMRSTAIGLMNATNCMAGGIGVFTAGVLKSSYGLKSVFAGCSIVMLLSSALLLAGYRFFAERDLRHSDALDGIPVAPAVPTSCRPDPAST